jgi:hypothetical protein
MAGQGNFAWDTDAAAHLLRRAGFGGTPEQAEELAALGLEGAVDKMLAGDAESPPPAPQTDPGEMARHRLLRRAQRADNESARSELRNFLRAQRAIRQDVQFWWLERMRSSGGQAREKLTLFWHGHFATSQTKVKCNHLMLGQNESLRRLGAGPFRELCAAMALDPAMLVWLDGRDNANKAPNENFAREIMELFTLGEGHYTEDDIREAARCFTGWRIRPENGEAFFAARRHDGGQKTIFGQSGNFGAAEAAEIICAQPRCAEFLAEKLWEFYAYPKPDRDLVQSLAAHYRSNDLHSGELLRMMFTHPEFYAAKARASQVKSPVQWMVQASRELGRQLLPPALALPLAAELGQNLFHPPSVKGWDGGTAWINSGTLIRRSNTARLFVAAAPPLPLQANSLDAAAWAKVAPAAARADAASLAERLERVFLAAPAGRTTRHRLDALLAGSDFPCGDDTVREASVILLGSPEYNLC